MFLALRSTFRKHSSKYINTPPSYGIFKLSLYRLSFFRKVSKNVICVGGDHTISYALLRAASEQAGKPVSLLHFDTHLDTGRELKSSSGFILPC